jgi:hypothetical protein
LREGVVVDRFHRQPIPILGGRTEKRSGRWNRLWRVAVRRIDALAPATSRDGPTSNVLAAAVADLMIGRDFAGMADGDAAAPTGWRSVGGSCATGTSSPALS